jgi:putative oxidoreductase
MLQRCSALAYSLMRIVAGALFACHGAQKLFGALGGTIEVHDAEGLTAGLVELFGGSLISLGIFTPIAAFVASGEMAVAYFKAHAPRGFWPILNRGEQSALYCFVFLFIACQGDGRWSVHALWTRYFRHDASLEARPGPKANSIPQKKHP